MSENYLWSTYGVTDAGDDWNMAATPSYQGQTTAAFNADTFRILKAQQAPRRGVQGAASTCSRNEDLLKLYGGMPAVESKQDAFLQSLQADYTQTIDWNVAKEGVDVRRRAELRVVHARLQPDPRPDQHVLRPSGRPRRGSTSTPRSPT